VQGEEASVTETGGRVTRKNCRTGQRRTANLSVMNKLESQLTSGFVATGLVIGLRPMFVI